MFPIYVSLYVGCYLVKKRYESLLKLTQRKTFSCGGLGQYNQRLTMEEKEHAG